MQRTTGSSSRAGRSRLFVHRLAGAVGWLVFLFLAWSQFPAKAPSGWPLLVLALLLLVLLFALGLVAWIWWNRRIYRRRGSRRGRPTLAVDARRDATGRPVRVEVPVGVRAARVIRDGSRKRYLPEPVDPAAPTERKEVAAGGG